MLTFNINIPDDAVLAGGVQAAMYGQLLAAYTPQASGQTFAVGQWVYYTGTDYAAAVSSSPVAAFASYASAGAQTLSLPDVAIDSAHIVFGIGSLPQIPVINSEPQQPSPMTTSGIYDFVEFTYNLAGALYLNTTMIDQFGFPIRIQIDPADVILPDGAGVSLERNDVLAGFREYAGATSAFLQCAQDSFGNPLATRILSPKFALANGVQGVDATMFSGPASTLATGLYYYVVTALGLDSATGQVSESVAQSDVVLLDVTTAGDAVQVSWAPNSFQPAGTSGYNVYRGTPAGGSVTWGLIGNVVAAQIPSGAGGSFADTGQATTAQTPFMNPLASFFDVEIQAFFARFKVAGKQLDLSTTDGTKNGYVYSFQGSTTTDANGLEIIQLLLAGVVDSTGATVSSPPIPLQTPFNIYYPYWNTNTFNSANPAPPSWTLYPAVTASTMVFAAEGVFADNAVQPLPSGVSNAATYSVLLGGLENQIVAAITRGIANSGIAPQNWGNGTAPSQLTPTLVAGTGTLNIGSVYYYAITAVNANGETIASFEFAATPMANLPCVQLNWQPLGVTLASSFNIYRGTVSQQENVLVATVTNTGATHSFVDNGGSVATQSPPAYFPAGGCWSVYDAYFHQPALSLNGAAYAGPYDDQGGQSSTISSASPVSASITLWCPTPVVTVQANVKWQKTGVVATPGMPLTVSYQSGLWTANPGDNGGVPYDAAGNPAYIDAKTGYTLSGQDEGALIGRIGDGGTPFLIGNGLAVVPGVGGELELCINDDLNAIYGVGFADNLGSVKVQVKTG